MKAAVVPHDLRMRRERRAPRRTASHRHLAHQAGLQREERQAVAPCQHPWHSLQLTYTGY